MNKTETRMAESVSFLGMVMERQTRWNFLCEATNASMLGLYSGIVGPFTLPLAVRLGAGPVEVFLITAAPFIANLLSPFWAARSHNSRKLPWVIIPHLIWRSGMGLIGLFKNPAIITSLFVGTNVAIASANPAYGALVQKVYPANLRGRLMGNVRLILAAAMLPVAAVAGGLMDSFGPRWLYLLAGLAGLLGVAAYAQTREPVDAPPPSGPLSRPGAIEGLKLALSDRAFRRFLLAALLFHGGVLVAQPLYAVYQVKQMGLSNAEIGYLAVAWNAAWFLGFGLWGRVIDRKGPRIVVAITAALYLGLPLSYGLGGTFGFAMLGMLCQGMADAGMDLGGWNVILSANPERVGPYTSASMVVTGIRGFFGPLLGTAMMGLAGFQPTFLLAAALVAAGLWVFASAPRIAR